jgi:hypothetical protein
MNNTEKAKSIVNEIEQEKRLKFLLKLDITQLITIANNINLSYVKPKKPSESFKVSLSKQIAEKTTSVQQLWGLMRK